MSLRETLDEILFDFQFGQNEFDDDSLTAVERREMAVEKILETGVTFAPTAGA